MSTQYSTPYEGLTPLADANATLDRIIAHEKIRLARFIRQRVFDATEAEDILQDVFVQLVETWRLPQPIEQIGAWLFRVARNRIVDRFRKHREVSLTQSDSEDSEEMWPDSERLISEDGPEAIHQRQAWLNMVEEALAELSPEQRDTFLAHEIEGRSFKEMAEESGISQNTLLGWKHQAVKHLRQRLQPFYD